MFFKIMISYIVGYLTVSVEGYYIERFINICKNQKVVIWNLKRKKNILLLLNIRTKDFREMCQIAKKVNCKVKILNKKGFPFLMNRYKKRKIFVVFLLIVVNCIWISSSFVWNVDIVEESGKEINNLRQDLENAGLKFGVPKSKIKSKEIINQIRLKRNDISWIGIELKGTNAIVKVAKAEEKPEIVDNSEYCNVVSNKTGVITKINVQNGMANVKKGDMIREGDILINGWMEGKYTGIRYVHAKGEIEAKVWHTKSKKIPYTLTQTRQTGNEENKYGIKINNFQINFSKKYSKFKIYDTIETDSKIRIFSNFYLPISIVKTTYKETEQHTKKYTPEEAINLGVEELKNELEQEIQDKEKIVNKNVNTYEHENDVEVYVTYEVLENIGTNEKIVF